MIARRIAFSLVAVLAFFALGEGVLRVGRWIDVWAEPELAHTEFTYDARIGWQNYRPLRGLVGVPPRRDGVSRVLAVGDSSCYGVEVAASETFSARLGEELGRALGREVEVLNGGVAGFSSSQTLAYLERRLRPDVVHPDLVITYVGHNDSKRTATGLSDRELAARLDNPISGLARASLFFWNVPHGMIATPLGEWLYGGEVKEGGKVRVSPEELRANLAAIRELALAAGARVRFVVPVQRGGRMVQGGGSAQDAAAIEEEYAPIVREAPEAIDVLGALLGSGRAPDELFVDGTHPTALGHELIAGGIADALVRDGVLAGT